jgi:transposase
MTPAEEEARFIELWNQGVETSEIARQLGLKATTAQSRARRLQERGLILPQPRGGGYPSRRAKARQEGSPSTLRPGSSNS